MDEDFDLFNEISIPGDIVNAIVRSSPFDELTNTPMTADPNNSPTHTDHTTEDTKVSKRRQINRMSEAKRRNRLKNQFETLKMMLSNGRSSRKLTHDDILELAISELKQNRAKQTVSPFSTPSPNMDNITDAYEIEPLFDRILKEEAGNLMKFEPHNGKEKKCQAIHTLHYLADKSKKVEFQLSAALYEELFYSMCHVHPPELQQAIDKCLSLLIQYKDQGSKPLKFFGQFPSLYLQSDIFTLSILVGNYKDAEAAESILKNLLEKIPDRPTRVLYEACCLLVSYFTGDNFDLETVEKYNNDVFLPCEKSTTEMLVGLACVQHGKTDRGLYYIDMGIKSSQQAWGCDADWVMGPMIADAYVKAGKPYQALSLINKYIEKMKAYEIEGFAGISSMMKVRVEALMEISKEENIDAQALESEILCAYENSKNWGASVQLKCANTVAKVAKFTNNPVLFEESKNFIRETLSKFKLGEKTRKITTEYKNAQEWLKTNL